MHRNCKRFIEESNSSSGAPAHNGCSMIAASIVQKNSCTFLLLFSGLAYENRNDTMKLKQIKSPSLKPITISRTYKKNPPIKNVNCKNNL
jgi:hypothetical protein